MFASDKQATSQAVTPMAMAEGWDAISFFVMHGILRLARNVC